MFSPRMVLYQSWQFSQETHNSLLARYPCGTWGERGIGREKHRSLLCERLRGWHAKCVWSTTEHTTPSSHRPPRPGDTTKPEFPGMVSRAARCGIPADRPRSPHDAQRPPRLRWARRGKQRRRRMFANASRSLALRSGLVVCAEPEC